ncbi:hypothetical protein FocTR4_00007278 [Fusarium oxysporum f. sp. cubense]|uniref:Uncharacterized protein n=1 Tax=Fusarium oxysporum f. sp. cubense TaxID=61366 RepID=A0A5C6TN45_FUSOC|nr:hypothetical protein FocTR4_00007278 [Fusarium oxysporum f. sp. cubense]
MTSGGRANGGASRCEAPNSKSSLIHISRGQRPGITRQGPLREVQLIPVSQAEVINHFSPLLSPKLNPFFVANIDSVEPSISRQGRAAS